MGLEKTPEEHIEKLVVGFRQVRRVLRDDGCLWLNYGDKYAGSGGEHTDGSGQFGRTAKMSPSEWILREKSSKLKQGDLIGLAWRLALALQADGWILRSDVIWAKALSFCDEYSGSTMPESVNGWRWERHRIKVKKGSLPAWSDRNIKGHPITGKDGVVGMGKYPELSPQWRDCPGCPKCEPNDGLVLRKGAGRPIRAHEYIFLLTKKPVYYWDNEAARELENMYSFQEGTCSETLSENGKGQGGTSSVQYIGEGTFDGAEVSPISKGQGDTKKIPTGVRPATRCKREAERKSQQIQQNRGGQSKDEALLSNRQRSCKQKRKGKEIQGVGERVGGGGTVKQQAEANVRKHNMYSNSSRMEGNQVNAEQPLLLLQSQNEAANKRPHNTFKQGGKSHQREHSGSLPELQCEKRDENNHTVLNRRNLRDVFCINPQAYPDSHYATFPEKIPEICIKVSTSEKGCCPKCGSQWARVLELKEKGYAKHDGSERALAMGHTAFGPTSRGSIVPDEKTTLGWRPTCKCGEEPVPCIVGDPFCGSGTVCAVAARLGRNYIGIELNEKYIKDQATPRIKAAETGVPVEEQKQGQMGLPFERE